MVMVMSLVKVKTCSRILPLSLLRWLLRLLKAFVIQTLLRMRDGVLGGWWCALVCSRPLEATHATSRNTE